MVFQCGEHCWHLRINQVSGIQLHWEFIVWTTVMHSWETSTQFHLKCSYEAIKIINLMKSQFLSVHFYHFVWFEEKAKYNTPVGNEWSPSGKVHVKIVWAMKWSSGFFMRHLFLLEWLAEKLELFRFVYLADTFSKMKKAKLSLQGKQLTVFLADDINLSFQVKIRILENFYPPPWTWQLHNT